MYYPSVKACTLVSKTDDNVLSSQGGVNSPQAESLGYERFGIPEGLVMPEVPRIYRSSLESGSRDKLLPGPDDMSSRDGAGFFKGLRRRL